MRNWPQTLISQYSSSPHLVALLEYIDQWLSPDAKLELFFDNVMNIQTAIGYGLDVWGRIVGITRTLTVVGGEYLGFTGDFGNSGNSFDVGIWYSGQPLTSNYTLTDNAFRQLIYAKAAANITNGSIQAINAILTDLLFPGRGKAYVVDNLDMTFVYHFDFHLEPFEVAIVSTSGVMPKPDGTSFTLEYL